MIDGFVNMYANRFFLVYSSVSLPCNALLVKYGYMLSYFVFNRLYALLLIVRISAILYPLSTSLFDKLSSELEDLHHQCIFF